MAIAKELKEERMKTEISQSLDCYCKRKKLNHLKRYKTLDKDDS
jgi:hypothetical protein